MNPRIYLEAEKEGRVILLVGDVGHQMVYGLNVQIGNLAARRIPNGADLIIRLQTPGDDPRAARSLYQHLKVLSSSYCLHLLCDEEVKSAGMYILPAVPLERRYALPKTTFYLHPGELDFGKNVKAGIEEHLRILKEYQNAVMEYQVRQQEMVEILAKATHLSVEEVLQLQASPRPLRGEEMIGKFITGIVEVDR